EPQKTGFFGRMQNPNQPQTPEFKKLRRIYWILMGIALVAVILSLVTQMTGLFTQPAWMICLGAAYLCAIGGIVLDIAKIRPMQKAYTQQFASGGKKTPKQIKHETEAAAYAREIERAREAERAAKKGTNRAGMLKSKNRMGQGLEQGSANDKTKAGEKPID
ncbi:MAG: hypothetical protein FWD43_05260, partial [Coriobacteriia bacterium]|nr:hypothetical protein [Coriobacteriia bacterium]